MFLTVIIFIVLLAVLVLVHEFGHFIVAKRAGARVEEFGFGFPPRIFSVKKGETVYSINLFPIGGFVKIYGEEGQDRTNPRSFASKSVFIRSLVVIAGVLMNLILSVFLFSTGHVIGLPQIVEEDALPSNAKNLTVRIVYVQENSPASEKDLRPGDVIYSMTSQDDKLLDVKKISDVQAFTLKHAGNEIALDIKRGKNVIQKSVVPRLEHSKDEGPIGIEMATTASVPYPLYLAPLKGLETTYFYTVATVSAFWNILYDFMATGELEEEVSGPVGIFVLTEEVRQLGFIFLLQFMALISINLAIINIIPFPALDGGRLLFFIIEALKGSPVKPQYERAAHTIGFALLVALIILVTIRDIGRFL